MPSVTILDDTNDRLNVTGEAFQADGWYGYSDGLHTISIHVQNFSGRVYIEVSLADSPTEEDWVKVNLRHDTKYIQFPLFPSDPTGYMGGDTRVMGVSFKVNALWIRAVVDRSYLPNTDEYSGIYDGQYGSVRKIILGR
ncbi:hypothetical protein FDI40_gp290 [Agrobacterium phage Atu_ph07]|uniref:Uncharacterized protein n=1 Tax=Agrobacterium phage Atu_ph07 TaxID=2024264 RepID=A0A223VZY8_9CAUD|nr:hypothetical protein FDI40_gp290 [Agrobacterium phage Atu_ph07]ASV44735.1 hypothetical protein [Agrobacterium phage Atu_ph07]